MEFHFKRNNNVYTKVLSRDVRFTFSTWNPSFLFYPQEKINKNVKLNKTSHAEPEIAIS